LQTVQVILRHDPRLSSGAQPLRPSLLALALTLAIAAPLVRAQDSKLPDIGSSAGELLTPARQAEYGGMMLRELRNYDYLLEDPLISEWLQDMGGRLGADSDQPRQPFTFFMLKDRQINAFATLGGYIGVNAGLVLTAEREDEVAAVISHEIAHVTQQHVLRGVERAQRDQIPILLGMLGAIVLAQSAGGNSSGDASQAAIASAMGLMAQRQIDYTRSNEAEADRVGIRTLSRAGYDVAAMAGFFERMSQAMRGNRGGDRERTPDYLQTHPVTTTRISEARERAEQITRETTIPVTTSTPGGTQSERIPRNPSYAATGTSNPLLPSSLQMSMGILSKGGSGQFDWAKERLRVLSADTPTQAIAEYERIRQSSGKGLSDAQKYGLALARLRANSPAVAVNELEPLVDKYPGNLWLALAIGQAESRSGKTEAANQRFSALLRQSPDNRAVALSYAQVLNEQGSRESGLRAQAVLRPLQGGSAEDPVFQQGLARANELAGDLSRAGEAYAEAAFLNGRPEQALVQLQNLKKRNDLDYYARARIDARIATITPQVLELRRQGIRDPDVDRR
jgi:beta-barrel assembly-enhancing protease